MLAPESLRASLGRKLLPAYVLAGEEDFLRREAEKAVVSAALGATPASEGLVALDPPGDVDPAAVFDELRTPSLIAGRKAVVVRRGEPLVRKYADSLEKYLAHPEPSSTLVLHVERWDPKTAYAKRFDAIAVNCAPVYETAFGETAITAKSPLRRWLLARAAERKVRLSEEAVARMVELVGASLSELDSALERLSLAHSPADGPASEVAARDVDLFVAPSRSYTRFKVAELAVQGKAAEAFAAADACFEQGLEEKSGRVEHSEGGVAAAIVSSIAAEVGILYAARGVLDEGGSVREKAASLGVAPFKADQVERAAMSRSVESVAAMIELAYRADLSVKSGASAPRLAVERLILELGALSGGG